MKKYEYLITYYDADIIKKKGTITPVMGLILSQMNEKNRLEMNMRKRITLTELYGVRIENVTMAIRKMIKREIITRISPAYFFVNPFYYVQPNAKKDVEKLRSEYNELQELLKTEKERKK